MVSGERRAEDGHLSERRQGTRRIWKRARRARPRPDAEVALATVLAHLPVGVVVLDAAGRVVFMNPAGYQIGGAPPEPAQPLAAQAAAYQVRDALTGQPLAPADTPAGRALAGEDVRQLACLFRAPGAAEDRYIQQSAVPVRDARGRIVGAVAVFEDATREERLRRALAASEERYRALSAHATDLVAVVDAQGIIRYASPSYRQVLGHAPEDVEGMPALAPVHPDDYQRVQDGMRRRAARPDLVGRIEFRARHADGSWRTLEVTTRNRLHDPAVRGIIATARDVTDRTHREERWRHQALHDVLTGLPNRTLFHDRLGQALRAVERAGGSLALCLMDLNGFKDINDTRGHDAGDTVLREVGRRLHGALRASDTVARWGGDEFTVLLPGADAPRAIAAARTLLSGLTEPVALRRQGVIAEGSVGIALYPPHGTDAATLLRCADVALYAAKRAGGGHVLYDTTQEHDRPGG